MAGFIVDHLGIDLSQAAVNIQARPLGCSREILANTDMTPLRELQNEIYWLPYALYLTCLTSLAADLLFQVLDAFAFIGLGRADLADVGRHLADLLLVIPMHLDLAGLGIHFE